jgi:hypothetical protein
LRRAAPAAAASAAAPLDDGAPGPLGGAAVARVPLVGPAAATLVAYARRVGGMWRRFVPMLALFFCLSFW